MNIGAIPSNNSQPAFEACYFSRNGIKRAFGEKVLTKVESIASEIEKQSTNVDTFIIADRAAVLNRKNGFRVTVQKPNLSLGYKILSHLSLRPPYWEEGFVFTESIEKDYVGLLATFKKCKSKLAEYM